MMYKKKKLCAACFTILWLIVGIVLTQTVTLKKKAADYDKKLAAAELMQEWMDSIKEYRAELGLPLDEEDRFETGLLGEQYTFITTTHGAVEAKRTTANPDMASLLVHMLTEAGMKRGDIVGAGFSGSFPAMNLAVLAACQTLELPCIYIASVGSSTYGANQPELTFPDMLYHLLDQQLLTTAPVLITPGGYDDCGLDMDDTLREEVLSRISSYGATIMREPDFLQNLENRMNLYEEYGPIQCFIGVGGNLTTAGNSEELTPFGLLKPYTITEVRENSGLVQRYNAAGLPVLHILNIKQLMADYGMPFDPEALPVPGECAIYYEYYSPSWIAWLCVIGALVTLVWGFKRKKQISS